MRDRLSIVDSSKPPLTQSVSPAEREAIEAEIRGLAAELTRRRSDRGNCGISDEEYMAQWRGVRLWTPQELLPNMLMTDEPVREGRLAPYVARTPEQD